MDFVLIVECGFFFFFQAEDGIRDIGVTGVQTCALPIFGLAAADIACGNGDPLWRADLLHLNDWPSGLASAYLAWRGQRIPTILTIHNLAYQGNFDRNRLPHLGIPDAAFQMNGVEFYGKLSFLKAGIYYSSHITTVSATYAEEITRPEFGCGLDGLLRTRAEQGRLDGIINGIDASWDPSTDPYLVSPFSAENCRGKRANANNVRQNFGLALSDGPLFAVVSRLVHQKGVDLAISAAETIVSQGGQIAVIGQGEPRFESELDRKSTRLNSSHANISYAVFCLKKKKKLDGIRETQARVFYCALHPLQLRIACEFLLPVVPATAVDSVILSSAITPYAINSGINL